WTDGVRIVNLAAGPPERIKKDDIWPHMPAMRDQLLRFAMRQKVRYDVVHGNFWMSGWLASELRARRRIPAVQLFHALRVTKRLHQGQCDTSPDERIDVESAVIRGVDRVIATCPDEVHQLSAHYNAPADRIATIPLGVDQRTFRPVDMQEARKHVDLHLAPGDRVIVYVGRLVPRKGVRDIVRALARLQGDGLEDAKLVIVGGETPEPDSAATPEIGAIHRLARDLGVADRVFIVGKRRREELRHYYGAGDVMVTTPWYEPFGLTPLEAMACGRPVIGSNVGGIKYTVQHQRTGLLVDPEEPAALAAALHSLLTNPSKSREFGERGRRRVESMFTWQVVARRTGDLYSDLLRSGDSEASFDLAAGD
ncbi:MAG: glycosyltransferase, partial [Thermomicrobiales bacterium]